MLTIVDTMPKKNDHSWISEINAKGFLKSIWLFEEIQSNFAQNQNHVR